MFRRTISAAFILASAGSPALAQSTFNADDALAKQKSALSGSLGLRCGAGGDGQEIVVCGKRGPDPYRLPLGSEPEPGARLAGEAADQRKTMALNPVKCAQARPRPESDRLDLVAVALTAVAVAAKAAGKDLRPPESKPVKTCG
jgi:hypothetical protein